MSQTNTNTNTNTGAGNTNQNHNAGRGGQDRGGSGGQGRGGRGNDHGKTVTKYSFVGKMKDGPLSKLTITEGGHQAIQYKKIIDALPVFCADKGYKFIDDIIWTSTERLQASFLPTYPDARQWSDTYHVEVVTVDANAQPHVNTGRRPPVIKVQEKTHIFDPNLQKQFLSEHDIQYKLKLGKWSKLLANNRSLMTIIYRKCNDATKTEIALGTNYEIICTNAELIRFLGLVRKVCYGSNNGGLSFKPYKNVVAVKSLTNFTNAKPNDPHGFKEELKIK